MKLEPSGVPDWEVTPERLARELTRNPDLVLLDVREAHEWNLCRLAGARHVPLSDLPQRVGDLPPDSEIVTYCHHGARSLLALHVLRDAGFVNVRSLRGGIDAWATQIEPGMERY